MLSHNLQIQRQAKKAEFLKSFQIKFSAYFRDLRYSCSTSWAGVWLPQLLTTAQEHLTILRAAPSWSILHKPAHSPSFILESTLIRGILCSMQRADTSFLYMGSSQFSDKTHSKALRWSRALALSRRPRLRPSAINACLSTSWIAVLISMGPEETGAAGAETSSPSTSDMSSS